MIIDTHCHAGLNWFEPIESLIFQMDMNEIDSCVLIQHAGYFDNSYILDAVKKYPKKFRAMGLLNFQEDTKLVLKKIDELFINKGSGIRLNLNYPNKIHRKVINICNAVSNKGQKISVSGDLNNFSSKGFENLIYECSDTIFIIEHLAGLGKLIDSQVNFDLKDKSMSPFKNILNLSKYKNVYIKIPGLGELTPRPNLLNNHYPFIKDRFDIIRTTMDFFTSKRMMWGSDFPPVSNREGYRNSLKGILKLENISEDEKNDVFSFVPKKLFFS